MQASTHSHNSSTPEGVAAINSMDRAPEATRITPRGQTPSPLTHSQESLWFLQQLNPGNTAYHSNLLLRFQGKLDSGCLEQAIQHLIERHEPLRTRYPYQDTGPVAVIDQAGDFQLPVMDLSQLPPGEKEQQYRELIAQFARQPYDLHQGPVFRSALLHLADDETLLFFGMHHIGSDASSREVFHHELLQTYADLVRKRPISLPALPVSYSDYAHWQRDWMQGETLERYLAHWTAVLSGELPTLELPLDYPRPAEQTYDGAHQEIPLTPELFDAVRQFCRQARITPFHFYLSAYAILLFSLLRA